MDINRMGRHMCFLVPDHLQQRFLTYYISFCYCSLSAYLTLDLCICNVLKVCNNIDNIKFTRY